jgi:hypothetical protein
VIGAFIYETGWKNSSASCPAIMSIRDVSQIISPVLHFGLLGKRLVGGLLYHAASLSNDMVKCFKAQYDPTLVTDWWEILVITICSIRFHMEIHPQSC